MTVNLSVPKAKLRELQAKVPLLAGSVLNVSCEEVLVRKLKDKVTSGGHWFTGDLHDSIGVRDLGTTALGAEVEVGAIDSKYAWFIEKGSGPRGLSSKEIAQLPAYAASKNNADPRVAPVMAAMIQKTIETKGTQAYPFIVPTFDANAGALLRTFTTRLKTALALN